MGKSDKNRHKTQVSSIKTDNSSDKYLHYLILAGIIILTLIIYSGTFKNGFTNWDDNNITDNKDIQNLSVPGIVKIFSPFGSTVYEPLMMLTISLIYKFFGLNPTAFHSVSIFFHLLNIILVYLFVYELTRHKYQDTSIKTEENKFRSRVQIATFVTLFFAIHPMHTEAVCWISGLDVPQYSFYYLASLIFYLKYIQKKYQDTSIKTQVSSIKTQENKNSAFNIQHSTFYLISLFFFLLSLLSKSTAVTLPVVLILLDYYQKSVKFKVLSVKYWLDKIPFFLLAIVLGIITIITQKFTDTNNNMIQYSLFNKFFLLTYSGAFYIINLIAPIKLSAIHPSPELIQGFLPIKYYLSPILIILIIVVIIRITRINTNYTNRRKDIIFGTLFFLITISVALIAGKVRHAEVAERYTYIPYLGLFFIIGQLTINNLKFIIYNLRFIIVIIFILIFSLISYQRNKAWATSISLFTDVIEKYPRSYIPYVNRGSEKINLQDAEGALQDLNKAIELNPQFADAFYNRGLAKYYLGDKQGALDDYNKAIKLNPQYANAFYNRGLAKYSISDYQGAIQDYNKTIEINPQYAEAYNNRAIAKYRLGDKQGVMQDFNMAVEINPQYAEAFMNRGVTKKNLSDYEGALEDFNRAIEINPQYANAFYNRGTVKGELGDKHGALDDYNKAIEINPQFAVALYIRGIAKSNLGDRDGACLDLSKAGELGVKEANEMIKQYCH